MRLIYKIAGAIILVSMLSCKAHKTIDVMSYNIHIATPGSVTDFNITDLPAVADVINRENPDIVFLQEVDKFTERSGIESNQAKDLGEMTDMYYYFAGASFKSKGEQGQAVLSKFPIKSSETYRLPLEDESSGETRSLAVVIVNLAGKDVAFMTVHLDHLSDENRKYQLQQMLHHIKKYEKNPIVLGGDFNMGPDNEVLELLKRDFFMVAENHPLTFPQINPEYTLDYILLNKNAKKIFKIEDYYTVDERYASDHLPLVLKIKLK